MDHVLIVDDEPNVAFFLSKALERREQGYRVSIAQSGEEALEVLNNKPVDLLVTDLRMPGISGLELIRWVRASSPSTRTILITAYGNDEVEEAARRLEAYRYITKPFDISDFTEAVQGALGDVAISQPGLTVLSDKTFDAIIEQLDGLRQEVGARCIFLADMQGQCLAEAGYTEGLKPATLLALLAGGFATSGELARRFGDGEAINLNFHQGSRHEIYSVNVGDHLFTALVYDRERQKSRIGIVWLYTQRMIERLLSILSTAEAKSSATAMNADFGSAVMTELDTLFLEEGEGEGAEDRPISEREAEPRPSLPTRSAGSARGTGERASSPDLSDGRREERVEDKSTEADGSDSELFGLEEAIARGLIPPEFGGETV